MEFDSIFFEILFAYRMRALALFDKLLSKRPSDGRGCTEVIGWRPYHWPVIVVVVEARTEIEILVELEKNILVESHSYATD